MSQQAAGLQTGAYAYYVISTNYVGKMTCTETFAYYARFLKILPIMLGLKKAPYYAKRMPA
jgi:hypothetical protein